MRSSSKYITDSDIQQFIRNELWNGTIKAALQRNKTYKEDTQNSEKLTFKNSIRSKLEEIEKKYHERTVDEDEHIENLLRLQNCSKDFKDILINGQLNIGTCQKFLNIYLKGLWCSGILKNIPPQAPLDAIIKDRLNIEMGNWTQMENIEEYTSAMDQLRSISERNDLRIAELELLVYNGKIENLDL